MVTKIDALTFDFTDIDFYSCHEIELTLDLDSLVMKDQTFETFDSLLNRPTHKVGNLYFLTRVRLMLEPGGILYLINTYNGFKDSGYLNRMEILLNKAGFINIEVLDPVNPVKIKAERRAVVTMPLNYNLQLREVIEPEEIKRCHIFAKEFYFYKDFNYDLDVVKPFDLNCDHFAVYDMDGEIQSMARIILRVPGYYCPFMYATIAGDSGSSHFKIPGNEQRIGEIMAIYAAGKRGILAFKQMMEYLTQYGTDIAHFDSVWTTYDEEDNYTGTYYKNKFFMQETGEILQYRDFGGRWKLIYTDKIKELKELHHRIFQHKQG